MSEEINDDEDRQAMDPQNWSSEFREQMFQKTIGSEAAVVVLGDIGRSPRMCNHAKMLADAGYDVKIFGFHDSNPGEKIIGHERIRLIGIKSPPEMNGIPAAVQLPIKLIWNFFTLFFALFTSTSTSKLHLILMQNPPGLPTMFVCWMIAKLKTATFTIDWHNYMYSILRDKYNLEEEKIFGEGKKSTKEKIVRVVAFLEGLCGRLSDENLCVTEAMRLDLIERWGVKASRFYDRPPTWKFRKTTLKEIHDLYLKLAQTEPILRGNGEKETILTRSTPKGVELLPSRPLVLLSSTSWTADEKFEILLEALVEYDKKFKTFKNLPRILMIITGKGPLKSMYLEEIQQKNMNSVDVLTPWLEADDYPTILESADLGISLHTSTSGLDLPMKVVDMFGAKMPVLAKKFKCIQELVETNVNGFLFDDSAELASQIVTLSRGFPTECLELNHLKASVQKKTFIPWESMWWRRAADGGRLVPPKETDVFRKNITTIFTLILLVFLSIWMFQL